MAMFSMQPIGNEFHTRVRAGEEVWCKRYGSVADATTEAVELGIMEARNKPFMEETLLQRTWPAGFPEPATPVDAFLVELIEPVARDARDAGQRDAGHHGCLATLLLRWLCARSRTVLNQISQNAWGNLFRQVRGNLRFPLTVTYHGCPSSPKIGS